ncbi:MAG: cobyrinate a,c-diamide synthase [Candidatus Polarisedimenticolaceae bacterium]|nr:cobyrinate a,c-diamide synthase [Candidatus Polarisedimenticolaceae bacterium]
MQSGCGKTTAALALMQFLRAQEIAIAPFKAGPDFLDPLWHQAVTGRISYNLDTQMMDEQHCLQRLAGANDVDLVIIEGVMGLFDGRNGVGGKGSTLDLAHTTKLHVILTVDAKGMSGSIVPLVAGFQAEAAKNGVTISGVIANRVGSEHHAKLLSNNLTKHHMPPLVAWIEKNAPALPERHLGLKMPDETDIPDFSNVLHVNMEQLLNACSEITTHVAPLPKESSRLNGHTIAIAKDAACCFIYQANLDWLKDQGANLHFFSPIKGEAVPTTADAIWLPGGYPELHGETLSASTTWPSLRDHIEAGKPLLAECGGMMLLGEQIIDHQGKGWPMCGALPFTTQMQQRLAGLGYRDDKSGARGHEFHHSTRTADCEPSPAFTPSRGDRGISYKQTRSSYIHWWFPAAPAVTADWFGAAA